MGQSTIKLQDIVDDAASQGELAPALPTGGFSDSPALSIANDVMTAMIAGGPDGAPLNWKWNRILTPTFFTNSWQQDYFVPNVVNLGWLESCVAVNFSSTQFPKPVRPVETKRDLLITNAQTANVAKICWMQADTMLVGQWGVPQNLSPTGLSNPGPGVVLTNPQGLTSMPANPTTQVKDAFGNLWVVTQYGTCGLVNPFLANLNPIFPTLQTPNIVATTATDGTVIWTAVNPKGQGFRINPLPSQTGVPWLIVPVGQARIARFTSLSQTLDPIPDDYASFFKQGFFTQCFRRSPDPKVRAKFGDEWRLWQQSLSNALKQGQREMDDWGFVPSSNIMDVGWAFNPVNPAMPYGPWNG